MSAENGQGRIGPFAIFGACAVALVLAMVGLTWHMLRLERKEVAAREEARLQEATRLVLWRMDSAVSSVLGVEAARPYFEYQPFYPAARPYDRMFDAHKPGELLTPSPLLAGSQRFVQLHFQQFEDGVVESPQVPSGDLRLIAESLSGSRTTIAAAEQRLDALKSVMTKPGAREDRRVSLDRAEDQYKTAGLESSRDAERRSAGASVDATSPAPQPVQTASKSSTAQQQETQSFNEYVARQQVAEMSRQAASQTNSYRNVAQAPGEKQDEGKKLVEPKEELSKAIKEVRAYDKKSSKDEVWVDSVNRKTASRVAEADALASREKQASQPSVLISSSADAVELGSFSARWIGDIERQPQLLFVRDVRLGGRRVQQGLWMDWEALRQWLVSSAADLLPEGNLRPAKVFGDSPGGGSLGLRLASIPAELVPGRLAAVAVPSWSPMRMTLVLCWIGLVSAVGAIAMVLRASQDLAERRGRFVTAVTHELRTPLTTFCLYSQMLADGMVTGEDVRREYLATLKHESFRLAGIVENVLEYARLGRAKKATREAISLRELVSRIEPGLRRRAVQSDFNLEVLLHVSGDPVVRTDVGTVERIVSNLVDNACKYGVGTEARRIELIVNEDDKFASICVRDFGPGVPASERERIFRPFHRAPDHAHGSVPGLGLGLSLSKGLAENLGGRLIIDGDVRDGTMFCLTLPVTKT